ncbi:hypothetical protein [Streptomyces sp. 5-6(2022)]|uniref:hypothetical protein n=1 Tax=Streptomyces sp. 5-6(2022) TaxID=2936510 RepID=UPI0023B8D0D2|nr:hypothetical protein [Streptomyces sp. 5-6(2022)]
MNAYYVWTARVVVPGQGLFDARGAHRSAKPATERELKAAIARDVADKHGGDANEIVVTGFTYSEVAA